jgi:hypothetical protein
MRASKESAEAARLNLQRLVAGCDLTAEQEKAYAQIATFINAAKRKLPTEAAYIKDAKRRRR